MILLYYEIDKGGFVLIFVFEAYAFWGISAEHPALPQSYPVHLFQAHAGMSARSSSRFCAPSTLPRV